MVSWSPQESAHRTLWRGSSQGELHRRTRAEGFSQESFLGPQDPGAAARRPRDTHCLVVPAWLAGVLEAGKLAVLAGPAVLVNDALLQQGSGEEGRGRQLHQERQVSKHTSPRKRKPHSSPHPAGSGRRDSLLRPSGWRALTHTAGLGSCPLGATPSSTIGSVCSLRSHPAWRALRPRARLLLRADGFNKKS